MLYSLRMGRQWPGTQECDRTGDDSDSGKTLEVVLPETAEAVPSGEGGYTSRRLSAGIS